MSSSSEPESAEALDVSHHFAVLDEAFAIYCDRIGVHGDAWKLDGWPDSILHIRSKFRRIEQAMKSGKVTESQLDDALDLINYVVFFIRNVREGRNGGVSEG